MKEIRSGFFTDEFLPGFSGLGLPIDSRFFIAVLIVSTISENLGYPDKTDMSETRGVPIRLL